MTKENDNESHHCSLQNTAEHSGSNTSQWLEPGCVPGVSGGKNTGGGGGGGGLAPARCDWCLRPTVTVNTLCWLKASQRCQHRAQQQHNIGSQSRKGGAGEAKTPTPENNTTRQQQQHNMILRRRKGREKVITTKSRRKTQQQQNHRSSHGNKDSHQRNWTKLPKLPHGYNDKCNINANAKKIFNFPL